MASPLSLFESMSVVSATMVEAAQANDWDRLVTLEREMAALRDEIMRTAGASREDLGNAEAARKAELIATMLENDAEIRRHVEPWLASVRKLLSGNARDRAVRAAYGAFGP
ncbi:flagellar protein FliT [Aromatoleum toluclasticum]|uniref:flagellar protein FliT n=1 Tax=Aromatoleum toluclasticum TaxID=92003 RepID=UPI001D186466|nr:flagellar protein FliT [Aromatoleum toluclasticum]MCC4115900.1 flagellar protein FliT [Aromatoleum toluclasticum]